MAADLSQTRQRIDEINQKLLALFEERQKLVRLVAEYKKENGLPIFDARREQAILDWAEKTGDPALSPYTRAFFETVMGEAKKYQQTLLSESE